MRGVRAQYFFAFGVMGSVLPFLPVFLQERGLSRAQIGYVTGVASFGVVLTPVLVTLLADAAVAGRVEELRGEHGLVPGLAVVLVGNNPASESYVGSKVRMTADSGMRSFDHRLPETTSEA